MGQKVNPRTKSWNNQRLGLNMVCRWQKFSDYLVEDYEIRKHIKKDYLLLVFLKLK